VPASPGLVVTAPTARRLHSDPLGFRPVEGRPQKHLALILARELASQLATATFIADATGGLVFFNEPAEPRLCDSGRLHLPDP
jgi:hypothetical protein